MTDRVLLLEVVLPHSWMRNFVSIRNGGRPNFLYGRIVALRFFPLDVGNQPHSGIQSKFAQ